MVSACVQPELRMGGWLSGRVHAHLMPFWEIVFVGGGMTRRDWDADRTCRGTGTWNIVEGHLGDVGLSRHRGLYISTLPRKYIATYEVYNLLFPVLPCVPCSYFPRLRMLPSGSVNRGWIQPILRILSRKSVDNCTTHLF